MSHLRQGIAASLLATALLPLSAPLWAQGLQDPVGLGLTPPTSVATVDEASAVLVNPAGVGFTVGPELLYLHSSSFGAARSDVDSLFGAVTVLDTLGFGMGLEVARPAPADAPTAGTGFVRGSLTTALRIDETFSLGGTYRVLSAQAPGLAAAQMWDVGFTVRPFRFLAAGLVVENLVPPETGRGPLVPRAYRVGFGLRPGAEWATLGLEARLDEALRVDPALLLRVEPLPGLIASLQLATRDLTQGFGDSTVGLGLELNHSLLGAGVTAASSTAPDLAGFTAYARASLAASPSIFPRLSRVVKIVLADELRPVPPDNPWEAAAYSADELPGEIPLALERAARDSSVKAVLLEVRPISAGFGRLQALRRRLDALRAAGKQVFVFASSLGDREYYLASAADLIIMPPSGDFSVDGVGVVAEYLAGTFDHLGLRAYAVTAGAYKSAPEVFTRREPSPAAIEASTRLSEVIDDTLVSAIADARKLAREEVRELIDRGRLSPEEARSAKLIDYVAYPDEVEKIVEKALGRSPFVDDDYLRPLVQRRHWSGLPKVAVVPVVETIVIGRSSPGFLGMQRTTGAEDVVAALEAASKDDDVKAIVLRVDSPGGDPLASDLIWRAVELARKEKPVVASLGDVAASGGYYVACGADTIFAEPTTVTGSIGVFVLFFTGQELLQTLDVGVYEEQRGELANTGTFDRDPTEEELAALRRAVEQSYDLFKRRVASGRGLDASRVEELAQGRVWSGEDALRRKLVDHSGGLFEAIADARQRAGLDADDDIEVAVYSSGDDPLSSWRSAVEGARAALAAQPPPGGPLERLTAALGPRASWLAAAVDRRPVALLPFYLEIR